ncbi:MAG: hypothetical protein M3Z13_07020 [Candidatus Dormibacteraeota bacterium]|nr:hypothetical protein [Candidatus Dormibacteraeota bacterium]
MNRPGLARLLMLGAAAACALVWLRFLPVLPLPADLGPRPTVIVNDSAVAVLAVHCRDSCPAAGGVTIGRERELRAGPPGGRWRIEDVGGTPVGCLTATAAGQRLLVSQAKPCPA